MPYTIEAPSAAPASKYTIEPPAGDKSSSWLDRVKNVFIAPQSERDPSLGESVKSAISPIEILKSMGHDFAESAGDIPKEVGTIVSDPLGGAPSGAGLKLAGDVLGAAASPITGTLSNLARPLEYETGLRRNLLGGAASLAIPGKNVEEGVRAIGDLGQAGRAANLKPMADVARKEGYVLAPQMISSDPGIVSKAMAGWSGKIKTQQAASEKNQEITNQLAAKSLGLPADTHLTDKVFNDVRVAAGKDYEAVRNAVPEIKIDPQWMADIDSLGNANSHAAQHFPGIMGNQPISSLIKELKNTEAKTVVQPTKPSGMTYAQWQASGPHAPKVQTQTVARQSIPTDEVVELVKNLRYDATQNLKAMGDPVRHALGLAQRQAANHMDDLMERNITAAGNPNTIAAYKRARTQIAKSYDLEGATNSATGDVNALGLARLGVKGRPLTGELKTISDVAMAFPKTMQPEARFGGNESLSALDFFGSAAAVAHGNPGIAATIMGRPLARKALLSERMQNRIAGTPRPPQGPGAISKLYKPSVLSGAANTMLSPYDPLAGQ